MARSPNFFIVGAARSGTTSLWEYLKQHPDIFMPEGIENKEPSYFCNIYGYSDFNHYLELFADVNEQKAVGEASTPYLTSPESASRIREVYPAAKILILLRNPVDRAYSLYNWMIKEGYERVYPFEEALEVEKVRIKDEDFKHTNPQYYYNYLYFNSGCYAVQVSRYLETFSREQLKIILFDELKNDPVRVTQEVYDFLDVDKHFIPRICVFNKRQSLFSVPIQYFVKQRLHLYLKIVPERLINLLQRCALKLNIFFGRYRQRPLRALTRQALLGLYKDEIRKTANLINRDLDIWLRDY